MGSELVRADEQTHAAATQGFEDLVAVLADRMGGKPPKEARSSAVFALAAMIGAVTMSRVVEDSDASMAILEDVKQRPGAM